MIQMLTVSMPMALIWSVRFSQMDKNFLGSDRASTIAETKRSHSVKTCDETPWTWAFIMFQSPNLRSRRARMFWGWCCRRRWPGTKVCCTRFVGRCACNQTAVRPAGESAVQSAYCCHRTRPPGARRGLGGSPVGSRRLSVYLLCLCFWLRGRSFKSKTRDKRDVT